MAALIKPDTEAERRNSNQRSGTVFETVSDDGKPAGLKLSAVEVRTALVQGYSIATWIPTEFAGSMRE